VIEHAGVVVISMPLTPGGNIRPQGEDIGSGTKAVSSGTKIRPQVIGLLAALGIGSVLTVPHPVVSIVSIGPELFSGALPVPTHDVNGPMLAALTERAGGEVVRVERCDGDQEKLSRLLIDLGESSDLTITSGGISDSRADTMASLLELLPDAELWNVRLRPGKHLGFGFVGQNPVLSLPGNPVAALVSFELFGRLAIDRLAGCPVDTTRQIAITSERINGAIGRTEVLRGAAWVDAQGHLRVTQNERRGSGIVSSLPEANCLIVLPEAVEWAESGDPVEIRWIG
jgi:molybdopterin molybdotransferase